MKSRERSSSRAGKSQSWGLRRRTGLDPAVIVCLALTALLSLPGCGGGGGGSNDFEDFLKDLFNPFPPVAPSGLSYPVPPVYFVGVHIATLHRQLAAGTSVSYSISPSLPSGLSISSFSGSISGTPTAVSPATPYTVLASNSSGSATAQITIEVIVAPEPTDLQYSPSALLAEAAVLIDPMMPTNSGGAILDYSVDPELPAGLVLDPIGGSISGTPLETDPKQIYTITGNGWNVATSTTLTIEVAPAATSISIGEAR